jgi:hypothetical protein
VMSGGLVEVADTVNRAVAPRLTEVFVGCFAIVGWAATHTTDATSRRQLRAFGVFMMAFLIRRPGRTRGPEGTPLTPTPDGLALAPAVRSTAYRPGFLSHYYWEEWKR